MSLTVTHSFVSGVADGANAMVMRPSDWGSVAGGAKQTHVISGGVPGDVGLGNVENTALSTWGGSANLTTIGQLGAGLVGAPALAIGEAATGFYLPSAHNLAFTVNGVQIAAARPNGLYVNNPNGPGLGLRPGTSSNSRMPFWIQDPTSSYLWTFFDTSGGLNTGSYVRINGNQGATMAADGTPTITSMVGNSIPTMLDIVSDVAGPSLVVSANSAGYNAQFLDSAANYVFAIERLGGLTWGAGVNKAAMDVGLFRNAAGVLEVNSAVAGAFRDLVVRTVFPTSAIVLPNNTGGVLFLDTGAVARAVVTMDSGNIVRFQNTATGSPNTIMKPSSGGQLRVMNNAESVNAIVFFDGTQDLTIGNNTDSNYKLQVVRSGSSGTFLAKDTTATTGITKAVVQEGAGQSTTTAFTVFANDGSTVRFSAAPTVCTLNAALVVGGFGCNGKAIQTAFASGGVLAAYASGTAGFDTGAHASALYAQVVAIQAALVANGIMS